MAKSIRLKAPTQKRLIGAIAQFHEETGALLPDAMMVDILVNEALDARANSAARREQAEKRKVPR